MKRLFLTSTVEWPGVTANVYKRLGNKKIRMPFIMTPAECLEEDMSWLEAERQKLRQAGFDIFDYTITGKSITQIKNDLSHLDALYVCGGNNFYLKHRCNETGFGNYIRDWIVSGKPYIGTSAGSQLLSPDMTASLQIDDIHVPGVKITDLRGLDIVDFLIFPHWGSDEFREPYLSGRKDQMYNTNNRLILLNNYQYVEVLGDKYRIIDVRHEL